MGEVKIVMHLNCIYKRLISVNIVLILVFTMISTTAFADGNESLMASTNDASGEDYIIINGVKYDANEESKGTGWSYNASEKNSSYSTNTLFLWGYNGSSIIYSGKYNQNLRIEALNYENIITGNNEPGIQCIRGNLELSVHDDENTEDTSLTIRGGLNCAGVTLNEVESTLKIVSNDRTSSKLTKHYMNIYGGKNASGVKAGKVEIETGYNSIINIYGGTSGNAVEVDDTLKLESNGDTSLLGNNRSAVASNITDSKNIIICNENEYNLFGGNNEYDAIKITEYCKEQYLKCIPRSCNIVIDANGGTVNGESCISEEKFPISRGEILNEYRMQNDGLTIMNGSYYITVKDNNYYPNGYILKRDGYIFAGWYKNKDDECKVQNVIDVRKMVKENENKNITIYAGWFRADKGDIIVDATTDGSQFYNYWAPTHNNDYAAQSDGTPYLNLNNDKNQCKLPSCLYSIRNKFSDKSQGYELEISKFSNEFWTDIDNFEEKAFTDVSGEKYYLTTKGLYRAGDKVENNNDIIKIFIPYYEEAVGNIIYNLSGMKTYNSGNLIKQKIVNTSQDLCVYTIDDQYIDNPDNKKLIGWSLKPETSTLDYEVGEKIEAKAGNQNINLYAIWVDKDGKDKTITFNDISENTGLCYAAFYNSKGKQIKTVELKPDADRKVTVMCGYEEYYRIDHIKLFTMSPDRFAPVQAVQTAVKNNDGGFNIEI